MYPEHCSAAVALVLIAKGSPLRQRGAPLAGSPKGNAVRFPGLGLCVAPKKASSGSLWHTGNAHSCGGQPSLSACPSAGARTGRGPLLAESLTPEPTASALLPNAP